MFSTSCTRLLRAAPHAVAFGQRASWGLLGNVTYAGCQWLMLVVLAKLGTAEMMGQFALGFAIAAPAFLLTTRKPASVNYRWNA